MPVPKKRRKSLSGSRQGVLAIFLMIRKRRKSGRVSSFPCLILIFAEKFKKSSAL
jgi:hypothetical protein